MRLLLLCTWIACVATLDVKHRIATHQEIKAATQYVPASNDDMALGTNFVYSYINSHISQDDTSYTEKLWLTITNPNPTPVTVIITSAFPTFNNRTLNVMANFSMPVPITPVSVQTDYMDTMLNKLFLDNKAIWVTSDQKVKLVATNQLSDGSSEDKFAILPVCQLGTSYMAVADEGTRTGLDATNIFTAIATQDNTQVSMCGLPVTLNYGQQTTIAVNFSLSACYIKSDKPVAVVSGAVCGNGYFKPQHCSHEALMLYPISAWDRDYPYFKFQPEDMGEIMVFFEYPNTSLWLDGELIGTTFNNTIFYIIPVPNGMMIESNNPVYVAAVGSSNTLGQGTPFLAHVPSPSLFTNGPIIFATAMTTDEAPPLMQHFARVITGLNDMGHIAVDKYTPNALIYRRMGASHYYYVDVSIATGQHVVTADSSSVQFAVTAYGYGQYRSYAFNPGLNLPSTGTC